LLLLLLLPVLPRATSENTSSRPEAAHFAAAVERPLYLPLSLPCLPLFCPCFALAAILIKSKDPEALHPPIRSNLSKQTQAAACPSIYLFTPQESALPKRIQAMQRKHSLKMYSPEISHPPSPQSSTINPIRPRIRLSNQPLPATLKTNRGPSCRFAPASAPPPLPSRS
jgi:hypothetical protein